MVVNNVPGMPANPGQAWQQDQELTLARTLQNFRQAMLFAKLNKQQMARQVLETQIGAQQQGWRPVQSSHQTARQLMGY